MTRPETNVAALRGGHPWDSVDVPEGYRLKPCGLYAARDGGKKVTKIAGPVWLVAISADDAGHFGIVVGWIDRFGEARERAFPTELLHDTGRALPQTLARYGLTIVPGQERALATYLGSYEKAERRRAVTRGGWLDSADGALGYMLPGAEELIGNSGSEPVVFQPEQRSSAESAVRAAGTLEDWQRNVLEPCRGNPGLLFSVLASLSAVLLKPARLESGGFHYFGHSSRGKTTALQVAASVYGCGADPADSADQSLIERWNTTANGLEALAAMHNDALLPLDELHSIEARDLGRVIYNLMGGRGKASLTKNREFREPRVWRVLALSTGELSIRDKIEQEGGRPFVGQMVRFIDIPIRSGLITDTANLAPGDFVIGLKRACGRFFGSLAPAFLRALAARFDNAFALSATVIDRLDRHSARLEALVVEPEFCRAARRFALAEVTGALAAEMGLLPIETFEAECAVDWAFGAWLCESNTETDTMRGLRSLQAFIRANPDRFEPANPIAAGSHLPVRLRAGFLVHLSREGKDAYAIFDDVFQTAIGGADRDAVAQELKRLGFLFINDQARYKARHEIAALPGRPRLYTVRAEFLAWQGTSGCQ